MTLTPAKITKILASMKTIPRRAFTQGLLGFLAAPALAQSGASGSSTRAPLFEPLALDNLNLTNRIVMAPMTRGRAGDQRTANALMAEYYSQRAEAGLIVTEATAISPQGYGWVESPAIYTEAHIRGWRLVTSAVHARGARMFLQLWHMGRLAHPDFLDGHSPLGPSAIAAAGRTHTPYGVKPYVTPRAMTQREIAGTVHDYAEAARRAREAGFDGVEIHAGYGYLIDQFIRDGSNHRTDAYGGTVDKRLRFLIEVAEAVANVWSPGRVGVRLTPTADINDMTDSDPAITFLAAARAMSRIRLAYLHVVEFLPKASDTAAQPRIAPRMRAAFDGRFILNGGYDADTAAAALAAGEADAVAFARLYLANPDLVARFRQRAPLNEADHQTFYTGGAKGYTDYPRLQS